MIGLVEELSWDGRVVRVDHDDRYAHSRGGLYERVEAADPRHFPHEMLRFVDDEQERRLWMLPFVGEKIRHDFFCCIYEGFVAEAWTNEYRTCWVGLQL